MARRPSITTAQKRKPASRTEKNESGDDIHFGLNLISSHLATLNTKLDSIIEYMQKRNDALAEVPGPTQITGILQRLEHTEQKTVIAIDGIVQRLQVLENAATATPRRRKTDEQPAAPAAPAAAVPATPREEVVIKNNQVVDQGTPVPETKREKKPDRAACTHPTKVEIANGLLRCEVCGATLDKPAAPASPVAAPAAPTPTQAAPTPLPSVDDLRAVAITWIGKHSKEKFAEVLKKYGATNLSTVPEEQRAALMAELNGAK